MSLPKIMSKSGHCKTKKRKYVGQEATNLVRNDTKWCLYETIMGRSRKTNRSQGTRTKDKTKTNNL